MNHTPTPWEPYPHDRTRWATGEPVPICAKGPTPAAVICEAKTEEDAAHICHCVNLHDELVGALEDLEKRATIVNCNKRPRDSELDRLIFASRDVLQKARADHA